MKRYPLVLVLILAALTPGCKRQMGQMPPAEVYFSPNGGCTEHIVAEIDRAQASILVQAFSFTSTRIAKALVEAHRRGVRVEVIFDRREREDQYTQADFLRRAGIRTLIDAQHEIAHNKVMILDGQVVITGSFNFTRQAEEGNAENVLVIHDPALAGEYTTNWQAHAGHSEPYQGQVKEQEHRAGARPPAAARSAAPRRMGLDNNTLMANIYPSYLALLESGELARRAERAVDLMSDCAVRRACHVDRFEAEPKSYCRTGQFAYVSCYFAHHGEEECLRGDGGSGTIFFAHCNLRCVFCQNFETSWLGEGRPTAPNELARMMLRLQDEGCHNINLVTPSHVVAPILQGLLLAAQGGLRLPLVYNTGTYDALDTLRLLDGVIDVYLADFKFWDPEAAHLLAKAEDYREVACAAIREMHRQVGDLVLDRKGIARRGLLVRHLVMPNGLAGTREVMRFLVREASPHTTVNLMPQYRPAGYAHRYSTIDRPITEEEYREALRIAKEEGITRFA